MKKKPPATLKQPSKIVFHESGLISYRIDGRWTRGAVDISREDFMKLRGEDRSRLHLEGIRRGKDFVPIGQIGNFIWPVYV